MAENPFSDIHNDIAGYGSLGGTAIDNHFKVKPKSSREGLRMKLDCGHCGTPQEIIATWPEVVVISVGKLPSNQWKYDQGHIRPHIGCARCNHSVMVGITPGEAKSFATAAINAQYLSAQQAQQIAQQAMSR
jgi:hypothetical protein